MADRAGAKSKAESHKKGDMSGMSVKSGDKRPTEDGAGLTPQGAKKAGVKTAVTKDPSKLDPDGEAAKRRKAFCARSKSWTGERGKAARKRWNC